MADVDVDVIGPSSFGWDLLYALYNKHFTSEVNVIIVWTHFNLVQRGFKNVGIGEDVSIPKDCDLKETLPHGWHDIMPCRLRYFYHKKLYFLTIQAPDADGDIIMNLNRPCDNNVEVTTMQLSEIKRLSGSLEEIMPDWRTYMKRMAEDMIDPLLNNEPSKDVHVQTDPLEDERPSRRYQTPSDTPIPSSPNFMFVAPGALNPGAVGSADLDPLGGGGGGMLFQPPGMGPNPFSPDPLLPRGSVPPGARFDPIFPGRGGPRPRPFPRGPGYPDHDHLPPPGYDDMFS